jgi:hypothetical protein
LYILIEIQVECLGTVHPTMFHRDIICRLFVEKTDLMVMVLFFIA